MAALDVQDSCNSSSSTDSTSSDDEKDDLKWQRIREATMAFNSLPFSSDKGNGKPKVTAAQESSCLPSNRVAEKVEDLNPFGTTPGFRTFVAKKLSEQFDRQIVYCDPKPSKATHRKETSFTQEDVHLFSDSDHPMRDAGHVSSQPSLSRPQQRWRPRARMDISEDTEKERIASIAVSAEFLEQQRAMYARLFPSPNDKSEPKTENTVESCDRNTGNDNSSQKTKKKQKKQHGDNSVNSNCRNLTGKAETSESNAGEGTHKVVKKKIKQRIGDIALSATSDTDSGFNEKLKSKVDGENVNSEGPEATKTKKKKKKMKDVEEGLSSPKKSRQESCAHIQDTVSSRDMDSVPREQSVNCDEHKGVKRKKKRKRKEDVSSPTEKIQVESLAQAQGNTSIQNEHKKDRETKESHDLSANSHLSVKKSKRKEKTKIK